MSDKLVYHKTYYPGDLIHDNGHVWMAIVVSKTRKGDCGRVYDVAWLNSEYLHALVGYEVDYAYDIMGRIR